MPAGEPPHKTLEHDPGKGQRLALCEAAAARTPWLEVSRLEIDRPGPSYTVDTLRQLRRDRPDDDVVLLLGADRAASLPQWREPQEILGLASIAVARRGQLSEDDVREALSGLDGAAQVTRFEMPAIEVSSTLVRERVAKGRPYRFFVPDAVADRIEKLGLYQEVSV